MRHYRIPPHGDKNLTGWVRLLMGIGVLFHLMASFMMISNNDMFTKVANFTTFDQFKKQLSALPIKLPFIDIIFNPKRFEFQHSVLLFVAMLTILISLLILVFIGNFLYHML